MFPMVEGMRALRSLRGFGKIAAPGDFIAISGRRGYITRGVLLSVERDERPDASFGPHVTRTHVLVQEEGEDVGQMENRGPTSFYMQKGDKVTAVCRDYVDHLVRMVGFHADRL